MYKNKLFLITIAILMIAVSAVFFAACKPEEEEPEENNNNNVIELPVPIDQIESIALKEGSFPSIFRIGDELDYTNAKLLITLKVPVEEETEETEETDTTDTTDTTGDTDQTDDTTTPDEEDTDPEPPQEIDITADMVKDFATTAVGFGTMRIVYSADAPEFDIELDYEVISDTTFFITYEPNGGAFAVDVTPTERFNSVEGLADIAAPTKEYYEFAGWYTDEALTEANLVTEISIGLQNNISLYAKWTPITYTINFSAEYLNIAPITYTVESGIIALPEISTDGIEQGELEIEPESLAFAGWYNSDTYPASGKKATVTASEPANLTFYAKWEPKISIALNEGFEHRYQQDTALTKVKTTAKLTVTDYYGDIINNNVSVTDNMISGFDATTPGEYTLTITYASDTIEYSIEVPYEVTAANMMYLTYELYDGELASDATDRFVKEEGLDTLPVPTKTAYDFAGWYTSNRFTASTLKESFPANYATLNTILYAKWTPTVYNVNYYTNIDTTFEYFDTYTVETTLDLWEEASKEGYHFMGWFDNSACTGDPVTSIDIGVYGVKNFYAKWGAKVTNVTITAPDEFNVANGEMLLTAEVLPSGDDPAVFPEVTYTYVSEVYEGVRYYTGVEYDAETKVIDGGIFKAYKAGYVTVKASADGIESAEYVITVIVEDVEALTVLNDPLVVFPDSSKNIELGFEPFTAVPDYELIEYAITDIPNAAYATINSEGMITVFSGVPTFDFTVTITYGTGVSQVVKEVVFNVPQGISTPQELSDISNNLSGSYVLTADIDLVGVNWQPIGYAEQVGDNLNYTNAFNGMFFGNSYTISNLTMDTSTVQYITAGLFGAISSAYIEDVVLEDINIYGTCAQGTDYIGGIAGANRLSKINDCTVTGNINITGGMYVGGLVGQMYGSMKNAKTIIEKDEPEEDSILTIIVESSLSNLSVGGLVGVYFSGTISESVVTANITVNNCNGAKVGGVVGDSKDKILNTELNVLIDISGAEGNTSSIYAGGIAGVSVHNIDIVNAEVAIEIECEGIVYSGGISGHGANIKDADIVISLNISSEDDVYSGGIAGHLNTITNSSATINLMNIVTTELAIVGGLAGNSVGAIEGESIASNDITINGDTINFGGIVGLAAGEVDGVFTSDEIITLTGDTAIYAGGIAGNSTSDISGIVTLNEFTVNTAKTVYLGGIVGKSTGDVEGDVSATLVNLNADVSRSKVYFGGIAGQAKNIENSNAALSAVNSVSEDALIGGIGGQIDENVRNTNANITLICIVKGSNINSYIGGIAGKIGSNLIVEALTNTANIDITADATQGGNYYIGGIIGYATANISECTATGTISADSNSEGDDAGGATLYAGGIAGYNNVYKVGLEYVGTIESSVSYVDMVLKAVGESKGSVYGGGITGYNKGTIRTSYNSTGDIEAYAYDKLYVGGVVGSNEIVSKSPATISDCYAKDGLLKIDMSASGTEGYLGGFVGINNGTINYAYSKMNLEGYAKGVSKTLNIGGFVGYNKNIIGSCYVLNTATTAVQGFLYESATIYVGGFIGSNIGTSTVAASITNAYTKADVEADAYTGGFVAYNNEYGDISYALSLGEVNNEMSGIMTGGFGSIGLTGYTKCYYSTTASNIKSVGELANESDNVEGIEGHTDQTLKNNPYVYTEFDQEYWNIADADFPTLIFDDTIWELVEGYLVFIGAVS